VKRQKVVLIVEDSQDDEEFVQRALAQSTAAEVHVASDGEQALSALQDRKRALPDLILLDIKLPKLSGFEVLERVRAEPRTRFVPVVLLSSSDVPQDVARAYQLGANSYLRKPIALEAFLETVRGAAAYWLELNQPPPREEP
jgi:two-component system response regulator